MEDDLDAVGRGLDEPRVADVAEPDVERGADLAGRARRASPPSQRELYRQNARTRAPSRDEPLDEVAADEAVRPGDEDADARSGSRQPAAARLVELVALADVDPVVLDLERSDRAAAVEDRLDELGHRDRLARGSTRPTIAARPRRSRC